MADAVTCTLTRKGEIAVVYAQGQLDLAGAPRLRAALRKADAEQPAAVLVDLSGLRSAQPVALLSLPAPVDYTGRWYPPRLLCCASAGVEQALDRNAQTRELARYRTRDAAERAAGERLAGQERLTVELDATAGAPGEARRLLAEACRRWNLAELLPAGQLIISELCANVVVHAGTPMTVVLIRTQTGLHIVVRDRSSTPPALGPPATDPTKVNGRGLHLVQRLAAGWGYSPTADGKAVWAVLCAPAPQAAAGPPSPRPEPR